MRNKNQMKNNKTFMKSMEDSKKRDIVILIGSDFKKKIKKQSNVINADNASINQIHIVNPFKRSNMKCNIL